MKKSGLISISIVSALVGAFGINIWSNIQQGKISKKTEKFREYYNMLNQWLCLRNQGVSLEKYFKNNNYCTIAIYGMGEMGNRLYEELSKTDIKIAYGIDRALENAYAEIKMISLEEEMPDVDVIVVTAIFDFDKIEEELSKKVDFPIISLEEVVYEI